MNDLWGKKTSKLTWWEKCDFYQLYACMYHKIFLCVYSLGRVVFGMSLGVEDLCGELIEFIRSIGEDVLKGLFLGYFNGVISFRLCDVCINLTELRIFVF